MPNQALNYEVSVLNRSNIVEELSAALQAVEVHRESTKASLTLAGVPFSRGGVTAALDFLIDRHAG